MTRRVKWVVKRETENGWEVLSEHSTEEGAKFFWRGPVRKGEKDLVFEEVAIDIL